MSETLTPVLVLLVLWAAYRLHRRPGPGPAAGLGAAVGLAALGRDELILLARCSSSRWSWVRHLARGWRDCGSSPPAAWRAWS